MRRSTRRRSRSTPRSERLEGRSLFSTAILSGQTLAGKIATAGQQNTYTFSAAAGNTFEVSVGDTSAASSVNKYAPYVQVTGPTGTRVINTSAYGEAATSVFGTYTVPATAAGTYTIIVFDANSRAGGTYAVELVMAPGTLAVDSDGGGGAIASGHTKTGTINRYGDLDAFTFTVAAGNTFEVSVGDTSAASSVNKCAPYVQVIDPSVLSCLSVYKRARPCGGSGRPWRST